ncbi:hypothetical protein [Streptomyces sp. I4(2020)]|uniref:hypothetical protein n=1 Tax=Streptomyces sp. I4(2020) TaxID=2760981 RepID=UPI0018EEB74A|nr:hypothetical protein [Streptomyces sp. I4(2020)]MBJ6615544.1 hypothetical protein [Streptomyces sp. I3(2020)]MBJ6626041.1 hypothetical protein [Streptomyces sp. I4(2020)]
MSDALEKAEAAAREAAVDTAAVQIALAAVELAKAAQAQAQAAPAQHQCEHHHKPRRSTGEWLGIGGAACVGGVGIAIGFMAIAVCGISVAILALVLRSIWTDVQKGRR